MFQTPLAKKIGMHQEMHAEWTLCTLAHLLTGLCSCQAESYNGHADLAASWLLLTWNGPQGTDKGGLDQWQNRPWTKERCCWGLQQQQQQRRSLQVRKAADVGFQVAWLLDEHSIVWQSTVHLLEGGSCIPQPCIYLCSAHMVRLAVGASHERLLDKCSCCQGDWNVSVDNAQWESLDTTHLFGLGRAALAAWAKRAR